MSDGVIGQMAGDGLGPPAPYATIDSAARAGLAVAAPLGGTYEYAGAVISSNGGYYATPPVTINDTNDFGFSLAPGVRPAAIYHTHPSGGYRNPALSMAFSMKDVSQSQSLLVRSYIGIYYDRSIRYFDPLVMRPATLRNFQNTGVTLRGGSAGEQLCVQCF